VVGADKATIDTAVDAPDAGSNDWTNCDLLEIIISARTDEAVVNSLIGIVFNNDSGSVYDRSWNRLAGTSAAPASAVGETSARIAQVPGTSVANTSVVGVADLKVPNPTGTAFNKTLSGTWSTLDPGDSTQQETTVAAFSYRPVSQGPLTRLKLQTDTGGQKFKVGSQLLIYKRTAS
jgi:hypothetical protein